MLLLYYFVFYISYAKTNPNVLGFFFAVNYLLNFNKLTGSLRYVRLYSFLAVDRGIKSRQTLVLVTQNHTFV